MTRYFSAVYHAPMSMTEQFKAEIEQFLRLTGMPHSTFGQRACGDKNIVKKLRAGTSITLRQADRIKDFMRTYSGPLPHPRRGNGKKPSEARAA